MFVTVFLVMCLNAVTNIGCTQVPITDNTTLQTNGARVSMAGCLGLEGFETSKKYWAEHPDLHEHYQYKGWACQFGNKQRPDNGKA